MHLGDPVVDSTLITWRRRLAGWREWPSSYPLRELIRSDRSRRSDSNSAKSTPTGTTMIVIADFEFQYCAHTEVFK